MHGERRRGRGGGGGGGGEMGKKEEVCCMPVLGMSMLCPGTRRSKETEGYTQ